MVDLIHNACSRCQGSDIVLDYKAGDAICRLCGEILTSRIIDNSPEWNNYAEDDRGRGNQSRAEIRSSYGSQTIMVGHTESTAKALLASQSAMEDPVQLKAASSVDCVYSVGDALRLSPGIQVCEFSFLCT